MILDAGQPNKTQTKIHPGDHLLADCVSGFKASLFTLFRHTSPSASGRQDRNQHPVNHAKLELHRHRLPTPIHLLLDPAANNTELKREGADKPAEQEFPQSCIFATSAQPGAKIAGQPAGAEYASFSAQSIDSLRHCGLTTGRTEGRERVQRTPFLHPFLRTKYTIIHRQPSKLGSI
jgi:hypothetical protein